MSAELGIRPFPESGHTLIVNGIGQRGGQYAEDFIRILIASDGLDEVLGVSLSGVSKEAKSRIEDIFNGKRRSTPRWRQIFQRPADRVFIPPGVILDDTESAASVFTETSQKLGDTKRAVIHFISYERGNQALIKATLSDFRSYLQNTDQYGVLIVPQGNLVEKTNFDRVAETLPPESLNLPLILMDYQSQDSNLRRFGEHLSSERALIVGLAGLIANRRMHPSLNPNNYLQLLQTLTDQSHIIGVSIVQRDEMSEFTVDRANDFDLYQLISHIHTDLDESTDLGKNGFTSLPKQDEATTEVVTVQLPLPAKHKFWFNPHFTSALEIIGHTEQAKRRTILSFGHLKTRPQGEFKKVPMVTTRFYSAASIPGWNLVMRLVETL